MKKTELESSLEALLFYAGDIIPQRRLQEICEMDELSIRMAVNHLNEIYQKTNSGVEIIEVEVEKGFSNSFELGDSEEGD